MSQTDERRPGATGRRPEGATTRQPTSGVQSSGRRAESPPLTRAALSAALRDYSLAKADDGTDAWWRSCADRAIDHLAAIGQPFSADAVAALVPEPDHPCRWGARFSAAVRAGVVQPIGYTLSGRPSRHRGVQRLYVGGAGR